MPTSSAATAISSESPTFVAASSALPTCPDAEKRMVETPDVRLNLLSESQ